MTRATLISQIDLVHWARACSSRLRLSHSPIPWLLALVAVLSATAQLSFLRWVGFAFPQFTILRSTPDPSDWSVRWMVWAGTPNWWAGIAEAGLRASDRLLAINGEPMDRHHMMRFKALADRGYTHVDITALRNDREVIQARVPLAPLTLAQALEFRLPNDLLAWTLLALGLVIYRAAPSKPLNKAAATSTALIGGVFGVFFCELDVESASPHALGLNLAWAVLASLAPAALFDLAIHFTGDAERTPRYKVLSRGVWVMCCAIAVGYATQVIASWFAPSSAVVVALHTGFYSSIALLLVPIVAYALLRVSWLAFSRKASPRLLGQARIMCAGLVLVLPVLLVYLSGALLGRIGLFLDTLDARYFYLSVPLALSVSILRYQLFALESRLLWGIALVMLSAIVANVALSAMRMLGLIAKHSSGVSPSVVMFGVVLVGMGVGVSVTRILRRALERRQIAYEGVYRFNEALAGEQDAETLPEHIVRSVCDLLELDVAGLWLRTDVDGRTLRLRALSSRIGNVDWPESQPLEEHLRVKALRCWHVSQAPQTWRLPHAWMVAPLLCQGQPIGVLVMGKRWDEEMLSRHDLEMGALVAQQCALVLLNAQQMEMLRAVPKQVAIAQEQERARIARELHDTVQQTLTRSLFYIESARALLQVNLKRADELLKLVSDDLSDAARKLRQIRRELSAIQLDISLEHTLHELTYRFSVRSGVKIDLKLPEHLDA
ncbi:MAG: histidine kinase, partial [Thermoflexales bacterium]|nr:histidine kinase [Thermoflexales bacterium]